MTRLQAAALTRTPLDPYVALVSAILRQVVYDASHAAPLVHGARDWHVPAQACAYLRDTSPESGLTCLCDLTDADVTRVRPRLLKEAHLCP
jgi:hypothetical protein